MVGLTNRRLTDGIVDRWYGGQMVWLTEGMVDRCPSTGWSIYVYSVYGGDGPSIYTLSMAVMEEPISK